MTVDQWSNTMPLAMASIRCNTSKRGTWLCFVYKCLTFDPLGGSHRDLCTYDSNQDLNIKQIIFGLPLDVK